MAGRAGQDKSLMLGVECGGLAGGGDFGEVDSGSCGGHRAASTRASFGTRPVIGVLPGALVTAWDWSLRFSAWRHRAGALCEPARMSPFGRMSFI